MKQKYFNIEASKDDKVARINIFGYIGSYWEGNDARSFQHEFNKLEEKYDRIDVHINSYGGSVHEGLPIYNAIKASKKEVHTYCVGVAMSMGFMILMAAKKGRVHSYKGAVLMVHTVSTGVYGNAKKFRKEADTLDTYDSVLASLLAERTGKTEDEVKELWLNHEDHHFKPTEALDEGFIDFIEETEAEDMPENVQNLSHHEIAAFYDERMEEPSDSFINKVVARMKKLPGISNSNNKSNHMFGNKFPKMAALAKVAAADVTAKLVEAANTEIAEMEIEGVTLVLDSELQASVDKITNLESEATEKDTKITDLEAAATVKDTEITNLKAKVAKLEGKPAEEVTTPVAKKDTIPEGDGGGEVDDFRTSVDDEFEALWKKD